MATVKHPKLPKPKVSKSHAVPDCPECGVKMMTRDGPHGPFFGCPRFPACKGTRFADGAVPEPSPSSDIVLVQDTREKFPLLFPASLDLHGRIRQVRIVKRAMPAGDYTLDGCEDLSIVERKGSLREIHQNLLTSDKRRFKRAIDRLCGATAHPILLIEGTPYQFTTPTRDFPRPASILQLLLDLCAERRIDILMPGNFRRPARRRSTGELVLRILLSHAIAAGRL